MRIGEGGRRTRISARTQRCFEDHVILVPGRFWNGCRDYTTYGRKQVMAVRNLSVATVPSRFIKLVLDRQTRVTAWTRTCDDLLSGTGNDQVTYLDSKITCANPFRLL